MDPVTIAMISIGLTATSEIIALSPLKQNSIIQIALEILSRIFVTKKKA